MTTKTQRPIYRGNPFWAISYAFTSLRNYPLRNMGIALVLAIGVALPTTVFVWSSTGTNMVTHQYFETHSFQMAMLPDAGENFESSRMGDAMTEVTASPYIEAAHLVPSTIGILAGGVFPEWSQYDMTGQVYRDGMKDMRVMLVTNDFLSNASVDFEYNGTFHLDPGQVLVSENFITYTEQVYNVTLTIGSTISFDLLQLGSHATAGDPNSLGAVRFSNLVIAGIYRSPTKRLLVTQVFPSMSRKNWDPMSLYTEPVLGLADSVMMLQSDAGEAVIANVRNRGFFAPVVFLRGSVEGLIEGGVGAIGAHLVSVREQLSEAYPKITIKGLSEIWSLDATIRTYLESQILTIIVFPVLIMSLMLTVFTSETSIARRKGEISALRAKGASFNQVFSTFMWESLVLSVLGFVIGVFLALLMAPLVGSASGLFQFDRTMMTEFVKYLTIPPLALVIAGALAMYLPASYLLHVARRIDVSEVGQPTANVPDEETEETSVLRYAVGLSLVLGFLLALPEIMAPRGAAAIGEIVLTTLLLFVASYFGSKTMRYVTSRLSGGTNFLLGEKALYLSRSLRKRKAQFIPLLVILTLTLTTTSMMIIQSSSFRATLDHEIGYAIGADLRVEGDVLPVEFNKSILQQPGVYRVTPVLQSIGSVGSNTFFLEGIDPLNYSKIGYFTQDSFVSGTAQQVLSALAETYAGIIISDFYSQLWNRSIGDSVTMTFSMVNGTRTMDFEIVGIMRSAPGFGMASVTDLPGRSFGSQLGFQVVGEGFALVNLDFLYREAYIHTADLFLADAVDFANITAAIESIQALGQLDVYSPLTFDIAAQSYSIDLFLSGINGLTIIAFVLCALMGLSAIALFLGSAVLERKSEYAIFRALGGTRRQVVSIVFGEFAGTVVAAIGISILLGLVFGYSMSLLTFGISPFSPILPEVLSFPLQIMGLTILAESAVMILSCYIPARRAGAVDPAVVLRNL